MQLIERRSGDLPVVLLIQVTDGDRICQELIEILDALAAYRLAECDGQLHQLPERLDLVRRLMHQRSRSTEPVGDVRYLRSRLDRIVRHVRFSEIVVGDHTAAVASRAPDTPHTAPV